MWTLIWILTKHVFRCNAETNSLLSKNVLYIQQHIKFPPIASTFTILVSRSTRLLVYGAHFPTEGSLLDLNRILLLQILNPLSRYVDDHHSNFSLTQNDHPTLGIPFYYIHPCQTSQAVSDLLEQDSVDNAGGDERFAHWLDTWFAVVSSAMIF